MTRKVAEPKPNAQHFAREADAEFDVVEIERIEALRDSVAQEYELGTDRIEVVDDPFAKAV